uniref:SFRICE_029899 n=1 Tax=Spodoptera frugiperda TaxID=7108 RepID=A0A2H1WXW2_SPOFR
MSALLQFRTLSNEGRHLELMAKWSIWFLVIPSAQLQLEVAVARRRSCSRKDGEDVKRASNADLTNSDSHQTLTCLPPTRKDRRQWTDGVADRAQHAANTSYQLKELYEETTKTLAGVSKLKRKKPLMAKLSDLQQEAEKTGLKINIRKTKEMRSGVNNTPLRIGTDAVERLYKFTYLGNVVTETGGCEEDISSRIAKPRATYAQLRHTWKVTKDISSSKFLLTAAYVAFWEFLVRIFNVDQLEKCHEYPIDRQIKRRKWGGLTTHSEGVPITYPKSSWEKDALSTPSNLASHSVGRSGGHRNDVERGEAESSRPIAMEDFYGYPLPQPGDFFEEGKSSNGFSR